MGENHDDQVWGRILVLHSRVENELAKALQRRHGLGLSEYRALSRLAVADEGIMRIQDLAAAIGLNQSSVSRLVARLEDAGLTLRELCNEDRRGVYSAITDLGRGRQAAAQPTYVDTLKTALDSANSDPGLARETQAFRDLGVSRAAGASEGR